MIRVVVGHICAGKTHHVRTHAKPVDVVIDMDAIAVALSADQSTTHGYPEHVRRVAQHARAAAIAATTLHVPDGVDVWIVHAYPTTDDVARYRRMGASIVRVDAPPDVLLSRARAERPAGVAERLAGYLDGTATP